MSRMLPFRPHSDTTKSEQWVFNQLAVDSALDGYVILHSLGLARHKRKTYAECDFVVIGPLGVYCLEVKGGHVSRQGGVWTIGWPGKSYTSMEGPFKQAQSARGTLLHEVRARLGKDLIRRVPFGWGVMLPDVQFVEQDPEWNQECIFDERDKEFPVSNYLRKLAEYTLAHEASRGRKLQTPLSPRDIKAIVHSFRADFDLVPGITSLIRESHNELLSLSDEQYSSLETLLHPGNPRVICEGSAGTGKTVLAAEAARRLAQSGLRVLFLCFNRNLASQLQQQEFAKHKNITLHTIWGILYQLVGKAFPGQILEGKQFKAVLAMAEEAAITATETGELNPYDVLVIDEAQDVLAPDVMNALDWFLSEGMSGGRWVMFLDTALQASVYNKLEDNLYSHLSSRAMNLKLSINMRNPVTIAREAAMVTGTMPPKCRRQFIAPVDYRTIHGAKTVHKVSMSLITHLISEGADPSDIVLLSFRAPSEAFYVDGYSSIGKKVHVLDGDKDDIPMGAIPAASIPAFKGLESEIVIIGDLPEGEMNEWQIANFYVALTRARTAAYVICSQENVDRRLSLVEG
ncbi:MULTISPECIES: NERD domain-containing protein [Gammaproteobacteria]|uniref:nuclease-related domain-containing DEAD/DEAH box helicase n=1 Tax=Gammaproteobacteria TaxID=1236 RepID=UPI003A90BC6A